MTQASIESAAHEEMCCPTCQARQAWSDECRRCKCDLSLLNQFRRAGERERRQCLRHLSAGRPQQALRYARRYATIVGAPQATPLLGACLLLSNHWPDACALAAT